MTPALLNRLPGVDDKTYHAAPFDNDLRLALQNGLEAFDGTISRIRPSKDGPGLEFGQELVGAFHRKDISHNPLKVRLGLAKPPSPMAYEIWHEDGQLDFFFLAPDEQRRKNFYSEMDGLYPNCKVVSHEHLTPDLDASLHVAGGYVTLEEYKYFPLRGVEGAHDFETTPLQEVTNALLGASNERTMLQVTFVPASDSWTRGRWHELSATQVAEDKRWGRIENGIFRRPTRAEPSKKDQRMAEAALGEEGVPGFHVNIRYFCFAPTPEQAINRAASIGAKLNTTYHNEAIDQAFQRHSYTTRELDAALENLGKRHWEYNHVTLNKKELGAIIHPPNKNVETNHINWARDSFGSSVPSSLPRKSTTSTSLTDAVSTPAAADHTELTRTVATTPATPDGLALQDAVDADQSYLSDSQGRVARDPASDGTTGTGLIGSVRSLVGFGATESDVDDDELSDYMLTEEVQSSEAFTEAALRYYKGTLTEEQIAAKYDAAIASRLVDEFEDWLDDHQRTDSDEDADDAADAAATPDRGDDTSPDTDPEQASFSEYTTTDDSDDTTVADPLGGQADSSPVAESPEAGPGDTPDREHGPTGGAVGESPTADDDTPADWQSPGDDDGPPMEDIFSGVDTDTTEDDP
jgi:hypothetical protein